MIEERDLVRIFLNPTEPVPPGLEWVKNHVIGLIICDPIRILLERAPDTIIQEGKENGKVRVTLEYKHILIDTTGDTPDNTRRMACYLMMQKLYQPL